MSELSVSADIGGTFTDVVAVDESDGSVVVGKSATVAEDPTAGIINGLDEIGLSLREGIRFLHGTTIGINTLLERKGATVGFITTEGFRDVPIVGTGSWPPFRLGWDQPEPLVPRRRCREVREAVRFDGTVELELNADEVLDRVEELVAAGADSIAICFFNAYANPIHERLAGEAIRERHPELTVVLSHELTRRYRETDRAFTAIAEAYLRPRMHRYFDRLTDGLDGAGFDGQLFITSSDGGVMGGERAKDRALRTLVSGCASGVSGAAAMAARSGWTDVLAIDMGGTSFDAAVVHGGEPQILQEAELAGLRFLLPMIDLATIGAGGGSIASVDMAGGLSVGPTSAGADPGPACYGRGGELPTFTDAALVAGLLPERLLDGGMGLNRGLAEQALRVHVADRLGLSLDETAAGIIAIIETRMAQTLEELTVGQGLDPRSFTMMAYGGGGPLVATELAARLGIGRVLVPMHPGVFSALGMQTLDIVHEFSRTRISTLSKTEPAEIESVFGGLAEEAREVLASEGVESGVVELLRSLEMRYEGQEHAISVPVGSGATEPSALGPKFSEAHASMFGYALEGEIEIVGFRIRAIGVLPKPAIATAEGSGEDASAARTGSRRVYSRQHGASEWPTYSRALLEPGNLIAGPAIVEEQTATTVVSHDFSASVDTDRNLVLSTIGGGADE
ncbi:MAG: hydantoinase/oxoprolinase family protein [Solirubrobacterales bacterium]